jgi:hypothetical protein
MESRSGSPVASRDGDRAARDVCFGRHSEHDFSRVSVFPPHVAQSLADGGMGSRGVERDLDGPATPLPTSAQAAPARPATPCPKLASLGQTAGFNHSNLPAGQRMTVRTYLGLLTRINLSPEANYRGLTGGCIQEQVTPFGGNCPPSVMAQLRPCTKHDCLPIARPGLDQATGTSLSADQSSFLDLHRTRHEPSVLAGSGVNSCSYTCFQRYFCPDRPDTPIGAFTITRNLQAATYTPPGGGAPIHITTGTVDKQDLTPPPPPKGDFPEPRTGERAV